MREMTAGSWLRKDVSTLLDAAPAGVRKIQTGDPGPWPSVDLIAQTCTCSRFTEVRSRFEVGAPARLCRCMKTAAIRWMGRQAPPWLEPLAADDWSASVIRLEEWTRGAWRFYVGHTADEVNFVSIYARRRRAADQAPPGSGSFGAYRLVKIGTRWSYGSAPFGAPTIKAALEDAALWRAKPRS